MPDIQTDGTHLISTAGHIQTPPICAITGTSVPETSRTHTRRLDHFTRRFFWPLPVLIYIAASIIFFKTIPDEDINHITVPIYILLTGAFAALILYLNHKIGRQSISLELHLSQKTKFLLKRPSLICGAVLLIYIALQLTVLRNTELGNTLHQFTILFFFIPVLLQPQFTPLKKIKIAKFQNNVFHITGLHPNLLKTLPKLNQPTTPPKTC